MNRGESLVGTGGKRLYTSSVVFSTSFTAACSRCLASASAFNCNSTASPGRRFLRALNQRQRALEVS
jgi:hypothetical protein